MAKKYPKVQKSVKKVGFYSICTTICTLLRELVSPICEIFFYYFTTDFKVTVYIININTCKSTCFIVHSLLDNFLWFSQKGIKSVIFKSSYRGNLVQTRKVYISIWQSSCQAGLPPHRAVSRPGSWTTGKHFLLCFLGTLMNQNSPLLMDQIPPTVKSQLFSARM